MLVMLVMVVATAKNLFVEQLLVAGTKQSRQAGWLTTQLDLPALLCGLINLLLLDIYVQTNRTYPFCV
jgi:hypothetical protein